MSTDFRARIRMYRHGFGDCFLVEFPRQSVDAPFRILIDCGVILGTPDAANVMKRVVDSLQCATGGDPDTGQKGTIDLLVITHEHWDHVSGFNQVDDWKDRFNVRRSWAGWTENPRDAQAQKLDKAKKLAIETLKAAAVRLGASRSPEARTINDMLAFYGLDPLAAHGAFGARATTRDGRDKALELPPKKERNYLEPGGDPLELEDVAGIRVFVLGPPRNKRLLKKHKPSTKTPETFEFGADEAGGALALALNSALGKNPDRPFVPSFEIPVESAEGMKFFRTHYFGPRIDDDGDDNADRDSGRPPRKKEEIVELLRDQSWRRIDNDWGGAAGQLAMKLDSATNNTSLALAFELEPDGDVLLFPGDAQVGNWLSWHETEWTGAGASTTAEQLLERTIFYKVGHHGSHNATLKEKGLEMMKHQGLIAMVPVNRKTAKTKGWHEMPLDSLIDALKERTDGRVLVADEKTLPRRPKGVKKKVWDDFTDRISEPGAGEIDEGLFVDIVI